MMHDGSEAEWQGEHEERFADRIENAVTTGIANSRLLYGRPVDAHAIALEVARELIAQSERDEEEEGDPLLTREQHLALRDMALARGCRMRELYREALSEYIRSRGGQP